MQLSSLILKAMMLSRFAHNFIGVGGKSIDD